MTVLSASMSLRRLQMVAKLRRISLQHTCQHLEAGRAIDITNNKINVLIDGTSILLNDEGELTLSLPSQRILDDYLRLLDNQFPSSKSENQNMVLTCDGAGAASWQRVGEYYRSITNAEIDELFTYPTEEPEEGDDNNG